MILVDFTKDNEHRVLLTLARAVDLSFPRLTTPPPLPIAEPRWAPLPYFRTYCTRISRANVARSDKFPPFMGIYPPTSPFHSAERKLSLRPSPLPPYPFRRHSQGPSRAGEGGRQQPLLRTASDQAAQTTPGV
ncbi:unnamed protein product, partial [Scytosiphon promiscuus]